MTDCVILEAFGRLRIVRIPMSPPKVGRYLELPASFEENKVGWGGFFGDLHVATSQIEALEN